MSSSFISAYNGEKGVFGIYETFFTQSLFWWDRPRRGSARCSEQVDIWVCTCVIVVIMKTRDNERIYYYCVGCCCERPLFRANAIEVCDDYGGESEWMRERDKTIPFPVDRLYDNGDGYRKKTQRKLKSDTENSRQMSDDFEACCMYTTQTDCHRG